VTSARNYYLQVARGNGRIYTKMLWDTGATTTVMSYTVAKRLGLLSQQGNLRPGLRYGADETVVIASGERITVKSIANVPLKLQRTGEIVNGKL
jgi:predicted aspartyl protease